MNKNNRDIGLKGTLTPSMRVLHLNIYSGTRGRLSEETLIAMFKGI